MKEINTTGEEGPYEDQPHPLTFDLNKGIR